MPHRLPGDRPAVTSAQKRSAPQCCLIRSLRPRIQTARRRPSNLCFSRSKPSASGFSEDGPQVAARPPYRSAPLGAWSGPPGASFTPMTAGHPPNARHLRLRHAFPEGGGIVAKPPYRSPLPGAWSACLARHPSLR